MAIGGTTVAGPGAGSWVPPERRQIGMVFQQLALFPHLDVAANVAYGLRGLDRRDRRRAWPSCSPSSASPATSARYPDQLSGGQAQRVALARALAPRPQVVLLDEPFSSLDVSLRADLRTEVRRILKSEGVTTLLVTHDQDEALSLGDQVAVMLDGTLAQAGPPEAVYRSPSTPEVAAFLGDANLVAGEVRCGVLRTDLGRGIRARRAGRPVLGPRPPRGPRPAWPTPRRARPSSTSSTTATTSSSPSPCPSGAEVRARLHARHRFELGTRVEVRLGGLGVVVLPTRRLAPLRSTQLDLRLRVRHT